MPDPNIPHQYYIGDIITFRGAWKVDGVEQSPDGSSGKAQIWKRGDTTTAILAETEATLATNQIQYKYTTTAAGSYALFFTAEFNSGADKRTGVIEFMVNPKKAY